MSEVKKRGKKPTATNTTAEDYTIQSAEQPVKKEYSALQKMKLVNALTGACSNKALLDAFSAMQEGEMLLEIFAEAVNEKLESMFGGNDAAEPEMIKAVDAVNVLYGKMVAINSSPVMTVLDRLLSNLGGSVNAGSYQPPHQQQPAYASPEHQQAQELFNRAQAQKQAGVRQPSLEGSGIINTGIPGANGISGF